MILSELVKYLNHLDEFDASSIYTSINQDIGSLRHWVDSHEIQHVEGTSQLNCDYNNIVDHIDRFNATIDHLKQLTQDQIKEKESEYFANSTALYQEMQQCDTDEQVLLRNITLDYTTKTMLSARVSGRADWRYPGVIIHPAQESWIDLMVSLDPLYIVDQSMSLLDPVKNKFNTNYINRVRDIVIDKSANQNILTALPNEQIGLCLVYNFFNFRPVEYINTMLEEIFQKLRSGGTLIITVNDCDRSGAVLLAERNFACYTPLSMLVEHASRVGYNVVFKYHINSAVTWLELAKPGELTSIKGGQALSKILVRS